jgi:hypothetical protein
LFQDKAIPLDIVQILAPIIAMGVVDMRQDPITNMVVASHMMDDYTKKGMIAFFFFLFSFVLGLHASERIS